LELVMKLWPDGEKGERRDELREMIRAEDARIYLAFDGEKPVGYGQFQLRRDYVEGCETTPVGYLEGIYLEPECRGSGLAARLLEAGQAWSRSRGCKEFASDRELENEASQRFHRKNGFAEANRIVCYVKKL
jgi:aminoglycoside 6'-N-acetyltransferase I